MKGLTAVALLAIALGAIMHFWPSGDQQPIAPSASENASAPRFACRAFGQSDARATAADDVRAITRASGPAGHRRATPGYAGANRDSRPGHGAVGGHFSSDDRRAGAAGNPAARVLGDVQEVDTAAASDRRPVRSRSKAAPPRSSRNRAMATSSSASTSKAASSPVPAALPCWSFRRSSAAYHRSRSTA